MTPDVLSRLRPQVTRQLVDERLRLQEEQKRKIIVSDKEIADAGRRHRATQTECSTARCAPSLVRRVWHFAPFMIRRGCNLAGPVCCGMS